MVAHAMDLRRRNHSRSIRRAQSRACLCTGVDFLFGILWGIGAVTYGLTMRYLGMALGMSVALGFCALFGTLIPPIFRGELMAVASTTGGQVVIGGVALCAVGILGGRLCGLP